MKLPLSQCQIIIRLRFTEDHCFAYNTKLRVPPYLKINSVFEGLIKYRSQATTKSL